LKSSTDGVLPHNGAGPTVTVTREALTPVNEQWDGNL
jgi:hypothetical protein